MSQRPYLERAFREETIPAENNVHNNCCVRFTHALGGGEREATAYSGLSATMTLIANNGKGRQWLQ